MIMMNAVGAVVVFAVSVGVTLGLIHVLGFWEPLSRVGVAAYEVVHADEAYERATKRGL